MAFERRFWKTERDEVRDRTRPARPAGTSQTMRMPRSVARSERRSSSGSIRSGQKRTSDEVQLELPLLDPAEIEVVRDRVAEVVGADRGGLEERLLIGVQGAEDVVAEGTDGEHDRGQRRLQLVRDEAEHLEVGPILLGRLVVRRLQREDASCSSGAAGLEGAAIELNACANSVTSWLAWTHLDPGWRFPPESSRVARTRRMIGLRKPLERYSAIPAASSQRQERDPEILEGEARLVAEVLLLQQPDVDDADDLAGRVPDRVVRREVPVVHDERPIGESLAAAEDLVVRPPPRSASPGRAFPRRASRWWRCARPPGRSSPCPPASPW